MERLQTYLWQHLGHCRYCMRQAFQATLAAGLGLIISYALGWSLWPASLLLAGSFGLWALHVIVYSLKVVKWTREEVQPFDPAVIHSRRSAMKTFSRAVASAGALTILPLLSTSAHARSDCPDDGYRSRRNGFGSCGQFCRKSNGETFPCSKGARPIFLTNGDCTCCRFSECT